MFKEGIEYHKLVLKSEMMKEEALTS